MPVIFCPACNGQLRVPDNLIGRTVRCPKCQEVFDTEESESAASAPPPIEPYAHQDEEADEPRRARKPLDGDEDDLDDDYDDRPRRRRLSRETIKSMVFGPAIALMITAGLGVAMAFVAMVLAMLQPDNNQPAALKNDMNYQFGKLIGAGGCGVIMIFWSVFVVLGAYQMMRLRSYGIAMASAIVAMLPANYCCLLGLPFGIWALVVLNNADVKDAFR